MKMPDAAQADAATPDAGSTLGAWVNIAAGTFTMGSPKSESCRDSYEDLHKVTLTHGFEIADHEVTQGQFASVMSYNPSHFSAGGYGTPCGASCPVENISWHEAVAYCNALSASKGYATCYACSGSGKSVTCQAATAYGGAKIYSCPGYRLPTEAEWEYAYRAGTTAAYYTGAPTNCTSCNDAAADAIGWYKCTSKNTTHPAGQKPANPWKLFDMAGNVFEWCHDWFQNHLGTSATTDPVGSGASYRVVRGGSWNRWARGMRAAHRRNSAPSYRHNFVGFRCARSK